MFFAVPCNKQGYQITSPRIFSSPLSISVILFYFPVRFQSFAAYTSWTHTHTHTHTLPVTSPPTHNKLGYLGKKFVNFVTIYRFLEIIGADAHFIYKQKNAGKLWVLLT